METRKANGLTVARYRIAGTTAIVYTAWEPYARHSTSTRIDQRNMGRVGTRQLTDELDTLPAWSNERARAVGQWHGAQYEEAYAAILVAFPEATDGLRCMGEISGYER